MRFKLTILLCLVTVLSFGQVLKVKSVIEKKTNFLGDTVSEHKDEFDKDGNLILRFLFNKKSQIESYRSYVYDDDHKLTKETGYSKDDVIQETWTYIYDENGGLIQQTRFYPITGRSHTEYFHLKYNAENQLIKKVEFDKDSVITWEHEYFYDRKAQLEKEHTVYKDSVNTETTYKYRNGRMVEMILYDFDNDKKEAQENTQTFYDYNKQGKIEKVTIESLAEILNKPLLSEEDYEYGENGHPMLIKRSNNGKFYSKTEFKYEFFY